LPVGIGLFAVNNINDAREAILEIEKNYIRHSCTAREIASEYLESKKIMRQFLNELSI
jgi:hypothetical protein